VRRVTADGRQSVAGSGGETSTRAHLLRRAALAGATIAGAGAGAGGLSRIAASAPAPSLGQDIKILNFLLLLEYLQAAFYDAAKSAQGLGSELRAFIRIAGAQERDHIALLKRRLGAAARQQPQFDLTNATSSRSAIVSSAVALEEEAASAYIGQAANLTLPLVAPVARICSVEARHAAWIRDLSGRDPAPRAADPGRTPESIVAELARLGLMGKSQG
jgi:Ferritin-like domain